VKAAARGRPIKNALEKPFGRDGMRKGPLVKDRRNVCTQVRAYRGHPKQGKLRARQGQYSAGWTMNENRFVLLLACGGWLIRTSSRIAGH
jgi:hypothetical protein